MSLDQNDNPVYPVPARRKPGGLRPPVSENRPARDADENASAISHTFLLWVFRQWWSIVLPVGLLLAAIAAALVLYFYVPKYEATALLMIEDVPEFVAFPVQQNYGQADRYIQTQLELLRGPVILEPVLGRAEIASMKELKGVIDRLDYVRDRLSVKQVGRSQLYNITYASPSSQDAANVANAVVAEYINFHAGDDSQRSQHVIDILEEERRRRGLEVERLRKRVVDLAKEVTGRDPFSANEVTDVSRALSPVGSLFQSLTEADVEREIRRAELQSLLDSPALAEEHAASSGLLDLEIDNQEAIRTRQLAIQELAASIDKFKDQATRYEKNPNLETNPKYLALKDELAQRQKELAETKAKIRDATIAQRKEKKIEDQAQKVAQMKLQLKSIEARRELLAKRFDEQVKDLQTGGGKSVELEFARAELEREEKVFEMIATRKVALQTELRAPARVELRHKADVPAIAREPVPYKLLLLACSAAFFAPLGLAVVREITVRRISDTEQLAQETRLRVLGEVAALPVRYMAVSPNQLSGRLRRDTYIFAESINTLRTNLALAEGKSQQILAVTSASPSEGKTSVAVSLAMSIANASDKPTLIIDGDMRSPFVASMLKAKNQPGLFEILNNKCKPEDAIQRVGNDRLYVIPAGRATKSTHSVVAVDELKRLLGQLRSPFASIVIDTPPIL
jgi:capsular polysaccharide biosynthesis protein